MYSARLSHITTNFTNYQQRRTLPHVILNRTILRQQRASNRPQTLNLNMMKNGEKCEEEDVREIELDSQPTMETKWTTEPVHQSDEQREFLYSNNQTGKRSRLTPHIQYDCGQTPCISWIDTRNRKVICHSCYCAIVRT